MITIAKPCTDMQNAPIRKPDLLAKHLTVHSFFYERESPVHDRALHTKTKKNPERCSLHCCLKNYNHNPPVFHHMFNYALVRTINLEQNLRVKK